MRSANNELLEKLGMRRTEAEGPLCLWSPENNKLISGYRKIKNRFQKSNGE